MEINLTHYRLEESYSQRPFPIKVTATNVCGFIMDETVFDTFQEAYTWVQKSEEGVQEYRSKFPDSDLGDRNYTVNIHPELKPQ